MLSDKLFRLNQYFGGSAIRLCDVSVEWLNSLDIDYRSDDNELRRLAQKLAQKSGYGWISEAAPISWLSDCLFLYMTGPIQSHDLFVDLMRSCNYYGINYILIDLYRNVPSELSFSSKYEINKQYAKYLKGIGDLAGCQDIYRESLSLAVSKGEEAYIAFTLMLYAKLCQDNLQRTGLYISYHRIAYNRIKKLFPTSNIDESKLSRWKEICRETYNRARFENRLLKSIPRNAMSAQPVSVETLFRLKFRNLEAQLSIALRSKGNEDLVNSLVATYEEASYKLTEEENPRATYTRGIRLQSFRRMQIEYSGVYQTYPSYDLQIFRLETLIREAESYSDRKMTVEAAIEYSYWTKLKLKSTSKYISREQYEPVLSKLLYAESVLEIENANTVTTIYFRVLKILAGLFLEISNWDMASLYLDKLHRCYQMVAKIISEDDRQLSEAGQRSTGTAVSREYSVLRQFELKQIRLSTAIDYKNLFDELIEISSTIRLLKHQIASHSGQIHAVFEAFQHGISRNLNNIDNLAASLDDTIKKPISRNVKEVKTSISRLEPLIRDFSRKDIDLELFVGDYIRLRCQSFQRQNTEVLPAENYENVTIDFNESVLAKALDDLVDNAIQVGKRNQVDGIRIYISFLQIDGIVYLQLKDNVGDYDFFLENIKKLNRGEERLHSLRDADRGGNGLRHIKKVVRALTQVDGHWRLERINNEFKKIMIPISKV